MKKDPIVFVRHILESIINIENFMKDVNKKSFLKNKEKQSAVIRQIEIIGEAVKNLPRSFKGEYPNTPWEDIAGMRDKLIHNYFGVNSETVWSTIKEDIPILKIEILTLLKN